MAKPALGRGLGSLMNGSSKPPSPTETQLQLHETADGASVGRGLGTLLQGSNGAENVLSGVEFKVADPKPRASFARSASTSPAFYIFLDLLLLGLSWMLLQRSGQPASPFVWTLCAVAVIAGALCACIPLLLKEEADHAAAPPKWIVGAANDGKGEVRSWFVHEEFPRFIGQIVTAPDGKQSVLPVWLDFHTLSAQALEALVQEGLAYYESQKKAPPLASKQFTKALQRV